MPNTVRLHRVPATSPEMAYRAFLKADALAKWLPPNGFACTVLHLQPRPGGTFKMSFRNFTTDQSHSFGGEYVELVPNECLRYTDKFGDPNPTLTTLGAREINHADSESYSYSSNRASYDVTKA